MFKNIFMIMDERRYKRAQLALDKGDEGLAREALVRRKSAQVGLIFLYELI
jgi:phage shock protein A